MSKSEVRKALEATIGQSREQRRRAAAKAKHRWPRSRPVTTPLPPWGGRRWHSGAFVTVSLGWFVPNSTGEHAQPTPGRSPTARTVAIWTRVG